VANPSQVLAGIYTAYFKDTINNCYSSGTASNVQVKIATCINSGANNDYVQFDSRSKGPKEIQTATNDTKTSGSKYSIAPNGNPKRGTATIDPVTGKVTYTITDTSYIGYDTITYQLCDTITNQCSTAYVIISLSHPKDTTITNNSDANSAIVIDGDKISGVPTKPSGASQQYAITTNPSGGTATVDSNGKIVYNRNPNACGKDSIQVTRTYTFKDGRPNETYTYWIYVYNTCADEDVFPNFITPNGDGKNDKFVIPESYLRKYPGAKLIIYNRWGNVVWRSVGAYQNDWSGIHYNNDNLPDGVYYYMIELKDHFGEIKNGFIQIMRD
jgi:gliding motility-associated-like protein